MVVLAIYDEVSLEYSPWIAVCLPLEVVAWAEEVQDYSKKRQF
jgi:hypothetical protein